MAVSKVVYDGNTLIDLTQDTVVAGAMNDGYTAHDASGTTITGDMSCSIEGTTLILPCGLVQNISGTNCRIIL